MEDLPQEFLLENYSMNVEFLENKTGEITIGAYLLSISEIVNNAQEIGTGALLIVNIYILGLIWRNDSIYLFDSHSKDQYGNISSSGTAVLLKFDTLFYSLENYTKSVHYNAYPLTLYFQVQFMKVHCTENAKNAIKSLLKKERSSARRERDLKPRKRKYHDDPEKKRAVRERYDKKETIKQYKKEKYQENRKLNTAYQKEKYHENCEVQLEYKEYKVHIPRNIQNQN